MNRDLFLAIIAMDAYNRGYGAGLSGLNAFGSIGKATIRNDSFILGGTLERRLDERAGFYAIAYDVSQVAGLSGTVISFRGTDSPVDALAFELGIGQPFTPSGTLLPQARMTIEFYRAGADPGADPFVANITTTGHSLGAGLAGYATMLYGKQGTLFANMAFENAAAATRGAAVVGSMLGVDRTLVYGDGPNRPLKGGGICDFAVHSEFLTSNRFAQAIKMDPLKTNGGPRSPVAVPSMALRAVQLWNKAHTSDQWIRAGAQLHKQQYMSTQRQLRVG